MLFTIEEEWRYIRRSSEKFEMSADQISAKIHHHASLHMISQTSGHEDASVHNHTHKIYNRNREHMNLPQNLQSTVWTLQKITQQLHS